MGDQGFNRIPVEEDRRHRREGPDEESPIENVPGIGLDDEMLGSGKGGGPGRNQGPEHFGRFGGESSGAGVKPFDETFQRWRFGEHGRTGEFREHLGDQGRSAAGPMMDEAGEAGSGSGVSSGGLTEPGEVGANPPGPNLGVRVVSTHGVLEERIGEGVIADRFPGNLRLVAGILDPDGQPAVRNRCRSGCRGHG